MIQVGLRGVVTLRRGDACGIGVAAQRSLGESAVGPLKYVSFFGYLCTCCCIVLIIGDLFEVNSVHLVFYLYCGLCTSTG